MKNIIKILSLFIVWIFSCLLLFLAVSFYTYQIDPSLWTETQRGIVGLLCVVFFFFLIVVYMQLNDKEKNNEKA